MATSPFDISFCIPTYNFGAYIGETLDSITRQADDRIEIVIVDGGSTDNTAQVIADKKRIFPHIKFIRRQKRCGVDADILESIAQATGQYCWLFSSDDLIADGAVAALRQASAIPWDVLVTSFIQCNIEMEPLRPGRVMNVALPTTFNWRHPEDRSVYFGAALSTAGFFSFISSIVVRRSRWSETPIQGQFIGSCWIIAAQIFAMRLDGLTVRYEPKPLVLRRGDNDSFSSVGLLKRTRLSISGFRGIGEYYFGAGSPEARHISRVIKNEYSLPDMIMAKLRIANTHNMAELREFNALARRHYGDGTLADLARQHLVANTPAPLLAAMLALFRRGRRLIPGLGNTK